MKNKKIFFAGIIGNILDHYDTALIIYMGSIMAPLFFKAEDTKISLIKFYGLLSITIISRPLGSLLFSKLANKNSPSIALTITLIGTSITTVLIGILPTYEQIGIYATIIFCVLRFTQTFFASGEHVVAILFLMDNAEEKERANVATFFNSSTMIGISLASFVSYLVASSSIPENYWRIPYLMGIVTSIAGILIRVLTFKNSKKIQGFTNKINQDVSFIKIIRSNLKEILLISILYIFSMATYYIPFTFMNEYIPIIHKAISRAEMLKYNTIFLYYDLALLLFIGAYVKYINYKKIIINTTLGLLLFSFPAFYLLQIGSLFIIESVRLIIITIGVIFLTSYQAYIYNICNPQYRYIIHGTGMLIGQDFIGRLTMSVCLFLWHYFDNPIAPSFYVFFISLITLLSIVFYKVKYYK